MRNILCTLYLVTLSLLTACTGHQSPIYKVQLLERLQSLQQQGTMFGHQDDPFYGITWEYEAGRSDVLESCGDWPAVMGFDLGGIEMGDAKNLDSVPFDAIREEIRAHHHRGGFITISWHPRNPVTTIREAHEKAVAVSAYVCTQRGAMPELPDELKK